MGMLSKAIKSDVITGSTKYRNSQEKIGQIIELNEDDGTCTVSLTTRDGINSVIYNVRFKDSKDGTIPWKAKAGEYVRLEEQYKRFVVTGQIELNTLNQNGLSYFSDYYADSTGGGCGDI